MNTVAVQLTGRGAGAIAVVLLAGEQAAATVQALAGGRRLPEMTPGKVVRCALRRLHEEEIIDDALLVGVAPQRYELHVHGGKAVVQALLGELEQAGTQVLTPEQAAARGLFGPGLAGEVQVALPLAQTLTGARLLAGQLDAGLTRFARSWQAWLAGRTEDDLWPVDSAVQWVLARSEALLGLLEAPRVAIVGPPNAGKSTLANALLGRPLSITSQTPGTTRDWVDAQAVLSAEGSAPSGERVHVPVVLVDTAGVRPTTDALELESIARAHSQAGAADVVLLLLDGARPLTAEALTLLEHYRGEAAGRLVVALNKIDLLDPPGQDAARRPDVPLEKPPLPPGTLCISAQRGDGLPALMEALLQRLDLAEVDLQEPFAFTLRQRQLLEAVACSAAPAEAASLLAELGR